MEVAFVYNHDVAGIHRRINRFLEELMHSASANGSQMSNADQNRLKTYLDAVINYVDWVVDQPELDLPETSPREWPLDANPEVAIIENESVRDVMNLMELARDETVHGQSARRSSGLIKFDEERVRMVIAKTNAFLTNYIQVTTPLDLPESSPMRDITSPGRQGV